MSKKFINEQTNSNQPLKFIRLIKIFVEPSALKLGFIDNVEYLRATGKLK